MSFASTMISLVASGIGVAICCVGLSIYLMLVKEITPMRQKKIELKK
jgi:hypothetical protein